MLGRSNQGPTTLRTTRAAATEDSLCPPTPPMGRFKHHCPPPLLVKGSPSPFLRFSKAWVSILDQSWEVEAELPSLFCKPPQGPGRPALILSSYLR